MHSMERDICAKRRDTRLISVQLSKTAKIQAETVETTMEEGVKNLQEHATTAENKVIDCNTVGKRKKTSTSVRTTSSQEDKWRKPVVKKGT